MSIIVVYDSLLQLLSNALSGCDCDYTAEERANNTGSRKNVTPILRRIQNKTQNNALRLDDKEKNKIIEFLRRQLAN